MKILLHRKTRSREAVRRRKLSSLSSYLIIITMLEDAQHTFPINVNEKLKISHRQPSDVGKTLTRVNFPDFSLSAALNFTLHVAIFVAKKFLLVREKATDSHSWAWECDETRCQKNIRVIEFLTRSCSSATHMKFDFLLTLLSLELW